MTRACDECLRRGDLLGRLAPRLDRAMAGRSAAAGPLLALPAEQLALAVGGTEGSCALRSARRADLGLARTALAEGGLGAVCVHSPGYPEPLAVLEDRPRLLFHTGSAERFAQLVAEPLVAIVGTRSPSAYGLEVARALGRGLGAAGVTVVSGLALGIDAAAHEGCLEAGGNALAVVAGGADVAYPRRHRRLHARVAATGAVVSEQPPGMRPYRWGFPARNRIMAGLAAMTVVVEAARESGSLITAKVALRAGREVGAVPGQITSRMAKGSNDLLRDGALCVTSAQVVLDAIFGAGMREIVPHGPPLDATQALLLEAVAEGRDIAGIAATAGLPIGAARGALARLEALGAIRRDSMGAYTAVVRE